MASKAIYFVLLVVALGLVVDDVEAGWKFWKKKKDDDSTTTTVAPSVAGDPQIGGGIPTVDGSKSAAGGSGAANVAPAAGNKPASSSTGVNANAKNGAAPGSPSTGTRGAIAGAGNPGLAIGVGNTGENIRNNARPQRPNPGTEVGLDISGPRPAGRPGTGGTTGQGYRDWAADLTGAGEGSRQPPKLPSQGPALSPGGLDQRQPGIRPGSPTSPVPGGQQQPGTRPGSPTNPVPGGQQQPGSRPATPAAGGQQQPGKPGPGTPTNSNGQGPPVPGSRPGSSNGVPAGQPTPGQGGKPVPAAIPAKPNSPATGNDGTQVSTLNVGPLTPGRERPGSVSSGYGSPGSEPSSPTGGKSWAEIAGSGGNGKTVSPTPVPRPGSVVPAQPPRPGQPASTARPANNAGPAGQTIPGRATGTVIGGPTGGTVGASAAAAALIPHSVTTPNGKVYYSNPSYSKGNTVTNEDLEKLSEALFIQDTMLTNANRYVTLNLQEKTTGDNPTDRAPRPLLTVNTEVRRIPTIERVIELYDNYHSDQSVPERITPAQRKEESRLVDTFLMTNVMSAAMRFLANKNYVRRNSDEYKYILRQIWFTLYSRGDNKIGSSGFEHVFLTELKLGPTPRVNGLHNWIYYDNEEREGRINYLGYTKKVDLGGKAAIVEIHANIHNIDKPVTTMFVGTSPELEMALYTVCFFTRKDIPCPVSLGGKKFKIVTYKFTQNGKELIGSAYPDISSVEQ